MTSLDESLGQITVAGRPELVEADPAGVFDRTVVEVGHTERERWHVVHEEVGKVLGGDHDDGVGFGGLDVGPHLVKRGIQAVAHVGICLIGATGDSRGVAAHTCIDQWH